MTDQNSTPETTRDRLLEAAIPHVAFDGWGRTTFDAAVADAGIEMALAQSVCPRGATDLAIAFHHRGDAAMVARLKNSDLSGLRFRERIAAGVRFRLEAAEDKEAVRRGVTLFALPQNAADGGRLIWGTADLIWTTLGDSSEDYSWYTKRSILSGVYGATVLFWLGDDSPGSVATWGFLDRRVDNVMQFEKFKAHARSNPLLKQAFKVMEKIHPPRSAQAQDLPGRWTTPQKDAT